MPIEGRLTPGLSVLIAASSHLVIVPEKIPASVLADRLSDVIPGQVVADRDRAGHHRQVDRLVSRPAALVGGGLLRRRIQREV